MNEILATFDLTPYDGKMILVSIVVFSLFIKWWAEKIFKPFLALFEAREQATVGSTEEADKLAHSATQSLAEFDQKVHDAHVKVLQEKYKVVDDAKSEASSVLKKAEDQSNKILLDARTEVEGDLSKARGELSSVVDELSKEIVQKATSPHTLAVH